jgi:hypothetical protein
MDRGAMLDHLLFLSHSLTLPTSEKILRSTGIILKSL